MDVRYVMKNVELPDAIRDLMDRKLGKLEKFFSKILDTRVEVHHHRGMYVVEITCDANGVIMRGEDHAPDLRKAFDKALKNIERQVKKHKEYLKDKAHMKSHDAQFSFGTETPLPPLEEEQEQQNESGIVKVKNFPVRPMTPEEATMQMDLLGHSFFVFVNGETGETNAVYRRKEGGFGHLVPAE